jgi:hypothetical protein
MSKILVLIAALAVLVAQSAQAATAFITFDDLATGPDTFPAASPSPQTIIYPQATFTGGVILGNATNFPAQSFATSPNIYGTAWFGTNLSSTLTIAINPTFPTNEISFPLFNGRLVSQSYTVSAFDVSNNLLTSLDFLNIPSTTSGGFAIVDLVALGIVTVTISPDSIPGGDWDFAVDSIALNQSLRPVPLPGALPLFATGLGVLGLFGWRRKRHPKRR